MAMELVLIHQLNNQILIVKLEYLWIIARNKGKLSFYDPSKSIIVEPSYLKEIINVSVDFIEKIIDIWKEHKSKNSIMRTLYLQSIIIAIVLCSCNYEQSSIEKKDGNNERRKKLNEASENF